MTNKEAIARIQDHKIAHKKNESRAIYISEALDMAIKALEQYSLRKIYCVMSGEESPDLDNVVYASTSKADAELFAYKHELYDYKGNPYVEVLNVAESEGE